MQKPNFFIIGAARAGTTSLYHYLQQHPEVYMSPRKEPRFFAFEGQTEISGPFGKRPPPSYSTTWEEYLKLFEGATREKAIGEASTLYLYHSKAPESIRFRVPDARLIAVLRNPVERVLSHYCYNVRRGAEPCPSFEEALRSEEERIARGWVQFFHYRPMGRYAEQLERYQDRFAPDQLRTYLYEDLMADPSRMVKDIFGFLGVDSEFIPDVSTVHNPSGVPKFPFTSKVLKVLRRQGFLKGVARRLIPKPLRLRVVEWEQWRNVKPVPKIKIRSELRDELIDYYREDILRLQEMIGRDLSHWLEMKHYE